MSVGVCGRGKEAAVRALAFPGDAERGGGAGGGGRATPRHTPGRGDGAPAPPLLLSSPPRLTLPTRPPRRASLLRGTAIAATRRGRREREATPPARSRAPATTRCAAGTPPRIRPGRDRHAPRRAGPLPDTGRGRHAGTAATRPAGRPPRQEAPAPPPSAWRGAGERGRAGVHTPAPTTHRREAGRGGEGRHVQNEKSGPVHQERPSLAWRGQGPARESASSPHRSVERFGAQGSGVASRPDPVDDRRRHTAGPHLPGGTKRRHRAHKRPRPTTGSTHASRGGFPVTGPAH